MAKETVAPAARAKTVAPAAAAPPRPPAPPAEPPDVYDGNGQCTKCGQPNARCGREHAVIGLDGDPGKGWQGYSLNNVLYTGKAVCVPKAAAQEMLAALNRWRNR